MLMGVSNKFGNIQKLNSSKHCGVLMSKLCQFLCVNGSISNVVFKKGFLHGTLVSLYMYAQDLSGR